MQWFLNVSFVVLFFISHPHVKAEHFDHLKVLTSGAAPLGHSDEERFIKKLGRETNICQGWNQILLEISNE